MLLLHVNIESPKSELLEWVIDRCYKAPPELADFYLGILTRVFNHTMEYPCEYITLMTVALLFTGSSRLHTKEMSLQLLKLIYYRFILQPLLPHESSSFGSLHQIAIADDSYSASAANEQSAASNANRSQHQLDFSSAAHRRASIVSERELFWRSMQSMQPLAIAERLALVDPTLTYSMFSEMMQRLSTAAPFMRGLIFRFLLPWMSNMELVDQNSLAAPLEPPASATAAAAAAAGAHPAESSPQRHMQVGGSASASTGHSTSTSSSRAPGVTVGYGFGAMPEHNRCLPLHRIGEGWGSMAATDLVLSNLFYATVRFGDEFPSELCRLWCALADHWRNNLSVILQYLIAIAGLATQVLVLVSYP